MKKIGLFMCAAALSAFCLTSCNSGETSEIILDGFYVVGEATVYNSLSDNGASAAFMGAGRNEAKDNVARGGMYEKYVALEGGKPFQLIYRSGTTETKYGATLNLTDTLSGTDEPAIRVYKGVMAENVTMQVAESGLYHIVLDLNTEGDLDDKLILVAPVKWGVRGVNGDWGWKEMEASAFNKEKMTYTIKFDKTNAGEFKFAYGGGWKIELDKAGNVKANTNLGEGMVNGAGNISILESKGEVTITLTWVLAGGNTDKSYSYDIAGDFIMRDVKTSTYSFIGDAVGGWDKDVDLAYVEDKDGTYTFKAENVSFAAGAIKLRLNHDWGRSWGYAEGMWAGDDAANFADNGDGNAKVNAAATYSSVVLTFDWNEAKQQEENMVIVFTK